MQRGYKTYTSLRAAAVCCALCAALLGLGWLGGMPAFATAGLALTFLPLYLLVSGLTAGFIPMLLCAAMTLFSLAASGGIVLMGFGVLYLLPLLAVYIHCVTRGVPFWQACGRLVLTQAAALLCIYLLLQRMTGGDLYDTAGRMAAVTVNGMPLRDELLYLLASGGVLSVPSSMQGEITASVQGLPVLSRQLADELLLQVRSYVRLVLQALVPSLLISGCGLTSLLGLGLGIHYGGRAAQRRAYKRDEELQAIPDLGMPPLRLWHIPRPWGLRIGLLAAGYLLVRYAQNDGLYMLGALMWQTFTLCFAVQGAAAINFAQHQRCTGRGWRVAVVAAAFIFHFVQVALTVIGVMDQFSNARGLRPPLRPRDEEE